MKLLRGMNWMSILGLCLIVLGTIFSFFGTYFSDEKGQKELTKKIQEKNQTIDDIKRANSKLIQQNSSLMDSNQKVSSTNENMIVQNTSLIDFNKETANSNRDLVTQNSTMLEKISQYQTDIEKRNKTIQKLESEIKNVKKYSNYAKMDLFGLEISSSREINFSSPLSQKMEKILLRKDKKISVKIDIDNIPIIDEVIKDYPNFPFGYLAKAVVLKSKGNKAWIVNAEKCIEILEITTSISGHNQVHDEVLKDLRKII